MVRKSLLVALVALVGDEAAVVVALLAVERR